MYNISDSTTVDATDNMAIEATRFIHNDMKSNLPISPIFYFMILIIFIIIKYIKNKI